MARERIISRTVKATKVNAIFLDIGKEETFNKEVILTGVYKDNKAILKRMEKIYTTDTEKPVHIVSTEVIEERYGMSEQDFVANSHILEPLKKKQ